MADGERPPGDGKSQRKWVIGGLAAGGLALLWVWYRGRGSSSGSSSGSSTGTVDSGGGSSSPTDLRDVVQVNYAAAPADREDNQPTHHHKPKPKKHGKAA